MTLRLAALVLLTFTTAIPAATDHAYFPLEDGVRLSYVTRTTLKDDVALHWTLAHVKTSEGPADSERVVVKLLANRWAEGQPLQRQEQFLLDPRGLFTPELEDGEETGHYGPHPLLVSGKELEQEDEVWRYRGDRPLPFAIHLLGLVRNEDEPVATEGRYHVLELTPIETPAGRFENAVEVTAIEKVQMVLLRPEPEDVLLRSRRFYVRGLGLVHESLQFLDLPRLGSLVTQLTGYEGTKPEGQKPPAVVASAPRAE